MRLSLDASLLTALHEAAFSMALTDAVDLWSEGGPRPNGEDTFGEALYDALCRLERACGWNPSPPPAPPAP